MEGSEYFPCLRLKKFVNCRTGKITKTNVLQQINDKKLLLLYTFFDPTNPSMLCGRKEGQILLPPRIARRRSAVMPECVHKNISTRPVRGLRPEPSSTEFPTSGFYMRCFTYCGRNTTCMLVENKRLWRINVPMPIMNGPSLTRRPIKGTYPRSTFISRSKTSRRNYENMGEESVD